MLINYKKKYLKYKKKYLELQGGMKGKTLGFRRSATTARPRVRQISSIPKVIRKVNKLDYTFMTDFYKKLLELEKLITSTSTPRISELRKQFEELKKLFNSLNKKSSIRSERLQYKFIIEQLDYLVEDYKLRNLEELSRSLPVQPRDKLINPIYKKCLDKIKKFNTVSSTLLKRSKAIQAKISTLKKQQNHTISKLKDTIEKTEQLKKECSKIEPKYV